MTDWQPYPQESVQLADDGKVTGAFQVTWQGEGTVFVTTIAHINDDLQAVEYRGESFLATTHIYRQSDGTFTSTRPDGETWVREHIVRRSNWNDAPPSFRKAIMAAITEAVEDLWTPERDRAGVESDVAQALHSLEGNLAKAKAEVTELYRRIRAQHKRLT